MNRDTAIVVMLAALAAVAWWFRSRGVTATVTTSETIDLSPYGGPVAYTEPVKSMARAIARAEGFGIPNAVPTRANNPGDLKVPGHTPTLSNGISVFPSVDSGWFALYRQLELIIRGQSNVYTLDMTIADMGQRWTATTHEQGAWSQNVADYLGVTVDTPLSEVLL